MSFIPSLQSIIDANNSTTATLKPNEIFTGASTNAGLYNTVSVAVLSDVDSADNGLSLQLSFNGCSWNSIDSHTVLANIEKIIFLPITLKYFRIVYTNGDNPQCTFRIQTILSPSLKVPNALSQSTNDGEGNLNVKMNTSSSGYNDLCTTNLVPIAQLDFTYGLDANASQISTLPVGTGICTFSNGSVMIDTGTDLNSSLTLVSKPYYKTRSGQSGLIRYAVVFPMSSSGSIQRAGVGNTTDGYFFGYNGTSFGIIYLSSAVGELVYTFIPQTSWNGDTMTGGYDGHSKMTGVPDSHSKMNLDYTKGNVYQIVYPTIGFGNVYFYIMSQITGKFILVHTLRYINNYECQLVRSPFMSFMSYVDNTSSEKEQTQVQLKIISAVQFIEGPRMLISPSFSYVSAKDINMDSPCVLTMYNVLTYNGFENAASVQLKNVSLYVGIPDVAVNLSIILNADKMEPGPEYELVNAASVINVATNADSVSGGTQVFSVVCGSSNIIDLTNYNIFVRSNEYLSFLVTPFSPFAPEKISCKLGVVWSECTC